MMESKKSKIIKELKKSKNFMIAFTDGDKIGTGVEAGAIEIMGMLSALVENLINRGYPKDMIKEAVKVGMMDEKQLKKYEEKMIKDLEKEFKGE